VASWDEIRLIAATLPEVVERGPREWRARDKSLAWERPLRPADRAALGAAAPASPGCPRGWPGST
jgi:hypothetical protein